MTFFTTAIVFISQSHIFYASSFPCSEQVVSKQRTLFFKNPLLSAQLSIPLKVFLCQKRRNLTLKGDHKKDTADYFFHPIPNFLPLFSLGSTFAITPLTIGHVVLHYWHKFRIHEINSIIAL